MDDQQPPIPLDYVQPSTPDLKFELGKKNLQFACQMLFSQTIMILFSFICSVRDPFSVSAAVFFFMAGICATFAAIAGFRSLSSEKGVRLAFCVLLLISDALIFCGNTFVYIVKTWKLHF